MNAETIDAAVALIGSMDPKAAQAFAEHPEARREIVHALYDAMKADSRTAHLADDVAFELLRACPGRDQ